MSTISHFSSAFWRTDVNLPSIVCRDPSGGRTLRMKCPVQSATSSPSKSMRPCLGTRDTLPGGRLKIPLKLPSTSDQPFIRRGSEVEKLFVFSDCKNREASNSVSAVPRACPNWRTVAFTSALIASVGSVVGGGVGSAVGIAVGIAVGSGIDLAVAVGAVVAVGLGEGAIAGTAVGSRVGRGVAVASSLQAANSTAIRARRAPSVASLTRLAVWAMAPRFNYRPARSHHFRPRYNPVFPRST